MIEGELGRGGMAAVFRARDLRLGRQVAIKVMSPAVLSDDDTVERFRQEAVTVANLSHANIVTIHAVREVGDLHFFVMKLVEGRALDRVLRDVGALPPALVCSIAFQVSSALAYAHRRGVIHRDIKPANILLDADGNAVVTDFGIAKVAEATPHTRTGMLIGTPSYMSPEQCMGLPVSAASDQYSLGVVVYEMLTGRVPFTGSSLAVLQQHISASVTERLTALADAAPADMLNALGRMMAKNPTQRFPSALHAATALGGAPLGVDDPVRDALAELAGGAVLPHVAAPAQVHVVLSAASVEAGEPVAATVEVRRADGTVVDAPTITWRAAPADVAVVDGSGQIVALRPGRARIIGAHTDGGVGEADLEVREAEPAQVVVSSPPSPFRVCDRWSPLVEVHDRRGGLLAVPTVLEVLPTAAADAPEPVLAPVAPGEFEAEAVGDARVRVRAGAVHTDVSISVAPALVHALALEVPGDDVHVGEPVACIPVAHDGRGRRLIAPAVAWSVHPAHTGSVDAHGHFTALQPGTVTVRAEVDGCSARTELRVLPARVGRVAIQLGRDTLGPGERLRATAHCFDRRGGPLVRPVTWRSSAPEVVRVDTDGWVEALAPGQAVLGVTCDGVQDERPLTVTVRSATALFAPPGEAPADAPTSPADAAARHGDGEQPTLVQPVLLEPGLADTRFGFQDARRHRGPGASAAPAAGGAHEAMAGTGSREGAGAMPPGVGSHLPTVPGHAPHDQAGERGGERAVDLPVARELGVPVREPVRASGPAVGPAEPARDVVAPPAAGTGGATPVTSALPASGAANHRNRLLIGGAVAGALLLAGWSVRIMTTAAARPQVSERTPATGPMPGPTPGVAAAPPPATESEGTTGRAPTPTPPAAPGARVSDGRTAAGTAAPRTSSAPPAASPATLPASGTAGRTAVVPTVVPTAVPTATATPAPAPAPARGDTGSPNAAVPTIPEVPVAAVPPVATPERRAAAPAPTESAGDRFNSSEAVAGMQQAIEAYAAGARAKNVGAMQRAHPSMTSAVRRNWEDLFKAVKQVQARAVGVEVQGVSADHGNARFGLELSYTDPNGGRRECHQRTQMRARLTRVGGGWFIEELVLVSATRDSGC